MVEYQSEVDLQAGRDRPAAVRRTCPGALDTNRLDVLVPNLVEAMFTGFPGTSGETVKITISARPKS